jgi:hypothetical protein
MIRRRVARPYPCEQSAVVVFDAAGEPVRLMVDDHFYRIVPTTGKCRFFAEGWQQVWLVGPDLSDVAAPDRSPAA